MVGKAGAGKKGGVGKGPGNVYTVQVMGGRGGMGTGAEERRGAQSKQREASKAQSSAASKHATFVQKGLSWKLSQGGNSKGTRQTGRRAGRQAGKAGRQATRIGRWAGGQGAALSLQAHLNSSSS